MLAGTLLIDTGAPAAATGAPRKPGAIHYRFGRHVRYLQADLDAWTRTRRRTST